MELFLVDTGDKTPLPRRSQPPYKYNFCDPVLAVEKNLINVRTQMIKKVAKKESIQLNILHHDNVVMCNDDDKNNIKIDFAPMFSNTLLFWWNHGRDCTHYVYSPSFYFPLIDSLYKAAFRSNLKSGQCKTIPIKSDFEQGPNKYSKHRQDNLDPVFYPKSLPNLGYHSTHPNNLKLSSLEPLLSYFDSIGYQ